VVSGEASACGGFLPKPKNWKTASNICTPLWCGLELGDSSHVDIELNVEENPGCERGKFKGSLASTATVGYNHATVPRTTAFQAEQEMGGIFTAGMTD
jgi:hypothetical protein